MIATPRSIYPAYMGEGVRIGKGLLDEIVARAAASPDEVCGLLLGTADRVEAMVHCRNVAPDLATAFEIDPAQLITALKGVRTGGPQVVGCYHSHPSGVPSPSPRDAAEAAPNGWLWLIVGSGGFGLFRAVQDGPLHGRFQVLSSPRP